MSFIDADDALCNVDIIEKTYKVAKEKHNEKIDIVNYLICSLDEDDERKETFLVLDIFNP